MVDYDSDSYELRQSHWNGETFAHLVDGKLQYNAPKHKNYVGFIWTDNGAIKVWKSRLPWPYICLVAMLIYVSIAFAMPTQHTEYYRVSFAESPRYTDGTLYCTVVNVSDREVTVRFLSETDTSELILLRPGDTIPTIDLQFVPQYIQYDQQYSFELEVQYE